MMDLCRFSAWIIVVLMCLVAPVTMQATTTRNVPDDYPTIQAAIDAAEDGDTVLLADGVYHEGFDFRSKAITLRSEGGSANCIIQGPGCHLFHITDISDGVAMLQGITISGTHCQNSVPSEVTTDIENSELIAVDCVFKDNSYESFLNGGGIIHAENSRVTFQNCELENNRLTEAVIGTQGLIVFDSCQVTLVNCTFSNNNDREGLVFNHSDVEIDNCTFSGNRCTGDGGAISILVSTFDIRSSTFRDNSADYEGGAIYVDKYSNGVFGGEPGKGNMFSGNIAQSANHIYCSGVGEPVFNTRYNHFSGTHNEYWISPLHKFDVTGCTFEDPGINKDVYVSPYGDNNNDGLSQHTPFKTIHHALTRMISLPDRPLTIHLAPGEYSPSNNGERFPVIMHDYLVFQGAATGNTILDAQETGIVVETGTSRFSKMQDLIITGGSTGGIYCGPDTGSEFNTCVITGNNTELDGAGIQCESGTSTVFRNCVISANTAAGAGSGVYGYRSGSTFTNCEFYDNTCETGGGVYSGRSHMMFQDCIFRNNETEFTGGGITCWDSMTQIVNCIIENNVSVLGGGVRLTTDDRSTVTHCIVRDNHALGAGGGINCEESTPVVANNLIIGNSSAITGGGVHFWNASPFITNCTIAANTAEVGGGVSCRGEANGTIVNSIVYFNHPLNIFVEPDANLTVAYSDIQGQYDGAGNIDEDPLFIDLLGEDMHLAQYSAGNQTQSPCIDTGNDLAQNTIIEIAGNPVQMADYSTRSDNEVDEDIVDMGFHYSVSQPSLTLSAKIDMKSILAPGERISITCWLFNPHETRFNIPVVFAVEIYGIYYFWPDWQSELQAVPIFLPHGATWVEILPWTYFPEGENDDSLDCWAFCALLNDDLTSIFGIMDIHQWSLPISN